MLRLKQQEKVGMFKKVVSQVTFSPTTIEQLAHFARSLRSRQRLHGGAIIALALLVVACVVVIFLPVHTTSTPTANDLIAGGVASPEAVLSAYDTNVDNFRTAAHLFSINRDNVVALQACNTDDDQSLRYTTGVMPYGDNEEAAYRLSDGSPLYMRPLDTTTPLTGWCGTTANGDAFLISATDSNIITSKPPSPDRLFSSTLIRSHTVSEASLASGQFVTWTLTLTNTTDQSITEDIWFANGDLSEYTTVISSSDRGISTTRNHHIVWPHTTVDPGETRQLTVTGQVNRPLDETAQQAHNPHAYDCLATTVFGNTETTPISCPIIKQLESHIHRLPSESPLVSVIVFSSLFVANLIVYLSLRLQSKELRIIRKQLNTGGF